MSAERDLKITIKADNQTRDGAAGAVAELKKVDAAAGESSGKSKQALRDAVKGHEDVGRAGVLAQQGILLAVSAANTVFAKGVELAKAYVDASVAAAKKSRELAAGFTDTRDQLRDLASMMGKSVDNKFVLENAAFNRAAAMRPQEGLAFRSAFQGSGAQFAGKSMSEAEFVQYERQAAQLTAARGLDANVGGELAGSILGMRSFDKFKDQASEQALGTTNTALAVLGRGRGDNSVLAGQLTRLASASVNEDATKGALQDPIEAAAMISVAAEKSPAQASELSMMALRGLRDFKNPLISKAKINAQTTPIDAFRKLAPIVEEMAKKKGVKPEDILRESFSDVGTAESIGVFLNKGITGGVFQDRLDYAKGFAGPKPAMESIAEFQSGETGQARIADASIEEAKMSRGSENSAVEIIRRQALARLVADKRIDTTATNLGDYISQKTTFGLLGTTEQTRIDSEVRRMLQERATKAGVGEREWDNGQMQSPTSRMNSAEGMERYISDRVDAIRGAGMNPFTGGPLDKTNSLLEQQNRMIQADMGGAPPALPAEPPPPMRRQ